MKYEQIETIKLIPYVNNARKHSDAQIKQIAASISEFGFLNPIIIDKDNGVIAGHGRLAAAQKLGLEHVPCVRAEHLTPNQKKAYIIADNKLAELAEWDEELLAIELESLKEENVDISSTGFSDKEVSKLIDAERKQRDADELSKYNSMIKGFIYTPKGEKPKIQDLCDTTKTMSLLEKIKAADLPDDIKHFLNLAASRHTVFDYGKIAEYYCHAPQPLQELMEESALVIIDFEKAIAQGFVQMTKELAEVYHDEQD